MPRKATKKTKAGKNKKLKLKTIRGAVKRFKKTAKGYKHKQSHHRHILTKKSAKRKRHMGPLKMVDSSDVLSIRRMLNDAS